MGCHTLPSWRHFWSEQSDLGVQVVKDTMSGNRFDHILSNLHVNGNTAIPDNSTEKLYKLRPMIDLLNTRFPELYNGTQEMSVDESMITFKGSSSMKHYNLQKTYKTMNLKGLPVLNEDKTFPRGESDYRIPQSGISVFKWKYAKVVLISSNYLGSEIGIVTRRAVATGLIAYKTLPTPEASPSGVRGQKRRATDNKPSSGKRRVKTFPLQRISRQATEASTGRNLRRNEDGVNIAV
ncbi:hypothetical protein PR048_013161 [Dryococelus australis]|uniref:PiggyBac transposable element-derived protein domain-containing protein n=1 Tax=Dryococelus australis TaxID=614101 RepID=A0ABQ9HRH1_9NEOP|nr:hypothetical protein PR048_013161 [Dryococelus australis]